MARMAVFLYAMLLLGPAAAASCAAGEEECSNSDQAILLQSQTQLSSDTKVAATRTNIAAQPHHRQDPSKSDNATDNGKGNATDNGKGNASADGKGNANATEGNSTNSTNEIDLPSTDTSANVNKILLVLLEFTLLPACFGIDRCFVGQYTLGIIKGVTFGGATIWAMIDYFAILVNCLEKSENIDVLHYNATFTKDTVEPAFYISGVLFGLTACWVSTICLCGIAGGLREKLGGQRRYAPW